ncbi:leukotoxin LktA family filamentous adhesin [Microbulbifer hainanensis]|uniref:leukotoxin LktA family filamentous adhesin n=1 Tax=Microbulbifer hainanensis TaxID=2735675 RepID=UPI0018692124|nr:leukotoxin LktA family filamentous adhesin [Microbulbifer hainanensis]
MKPFRHQMLARAIRNATITSGKSTGRQLTLGALLSTGAVNVFAATAHNIDAVSGFTTVTDVGGNTQNVVSNYKKGDVGVNVFNDFVVGDGHTVNLQLDGDIDQLVNIVRGSTPEVHGILNSYQDGTLGGNVVFASSYGFLVGPSGIINVGHLSVKTPSQSEIDSWLDMGSPDFSADGISALDNNEYAISSSGLVTISGKINSASGVDIHANQVVVNDGAVLTAGNAVQAIYVDAAMVNVGDYTAPTELQEEHGSIYISAAGNGVSGDQVAIDGDLLADGGITISADSINVSATATVDTRDAVTAGENAPIATFIGDTVNLAGDVLASNVNITADTEVVISGDITAIGSEDGSTATAGLIDIDSASAKIQGGADAVVLAGSSDDAAVLVASSSDLVIVGNIDAYDQLDVSGGSIAITSGNVVSGSDVSLHASDIAIDGSLTADATADGSTGKVLLDGDADYDDLGNITAEIVRVDTASDFYVTDDAASLTVNAGDIVWEDAGGAIDLGFSLEVNADDITAGIDVTAVDITLTATNGVQVDGWLNAAGDGSTLGQVGLSGATLAFDFAKISADGLWLTTSNNMVFAKNTADTEYQNAGVDDFKLAADVDFDGDLSLSAAGITVTNNASVTAANVTIESSDTNIDGAVSADAGDSDATTFGTINLVKDADYEDVGNLNYSLLAISTDNDIVLSDDSTAAAVIGAAGDDIVWVDSKDFDFSGSDISFNGSSLTVTSGTTLDADNISFDVDTFYNSGTFNASEFILLAANIDDSLDLTGLNASALTLNSDSSLSWAEDILYGGLLKFVADSITIESGASVTAAGISVEADSITVAGSLTSTAGSGSTVGDIDLKGKEITLASTGVLDTVDGDTSTTDGDVNLTASDTDAVAYGTAKAETSIDLSGTIEANNVTAKAFSSSTSSIYEEIGTTLGLKTVAALGGVDFNYMEADSDATVTVNSGANITAAGNVTLSADSHSVAEAMALVMGADVLTAALAGIYVSGDATSTTTVKSGATITAGGDLAVTAHNETYVSSSAFVLEADKSNKVVAAVAVGEADVDAKAVIETGATLDAGNLVVGAENLNRFYTSASVYGLSNTRYGIAVAVGNFNSSATAEMGADLGTSADQVGDVTVVALDRTVEQRVHSGVAVGGSILARTIGSKLVSGMGAVQGGVSNLLTKYLPGGVDSSASSDSSGKVDWKGGLSFSLNLSDKEAYAYLGTNASGQIDAPTIDASGNVLVAAATDLGTDNDAVLGGDGRGAVGGDQGGYRTSAETAVTSPKDGTAGAQQTNAADKSAALAFNFAIHQGDAVAEVGDYTTIKAQNLGVVAEQKMPIVSTYDRWDTLSDVISKFNGVGGLQNNILTTFANAGAAADKEAYGGSVNVQWNDINTKAWIGDGTKITTTGTSDWSVSYDLDSSLTSPGIFSDFEPFKDVTYKYDFDSSVAVRAYNLIESAHVAGNIGTLGILPNGNGTNDDGKSIGGSITFVQQATQAVAGIGDANITAAGDVKVTSETDERHFVVTPSSGMGTGTGFNGVIAILNSEALTHASLSNSAYVSADDLIITADHQMGNWAAAGAVNWTSGESAVGVAIAANITQGDTKAFIGDNSKEEEKVSFKNGSQPDPSAPTNPSQPSSPAIIARNVEVRGKSSGSTGSVAVAGALLTEDTGEPGIGQKFENWYGSKFGGWSGDLESNTASSQSEANSGSSSSSVDSASQSGSNDSSSSSDNGTASVDSSQTSFAGAGSVSVNVNNLDAKSIIEGATIKGHTSEEVNLEIQALEKIVSVSASGSAALNLSKSASTPTSSAMAGAIAYQITFNDTLAWLIESDVRNLDDLSIQALHGGELTSVGLALAIDSPSAGGKSTSAGLSVSGAQVRDGTSARMEGSTVSGSGDGDNDFEVSAYNNTDIGVGGGTLYGGGKTGFGLAITFADIDDPGNLIGDSNPDGNNVLSSAYDEDVYSGKAVEAVVTHADDAFFTNSNIYNFDNIAISARGLQRIGIGAAGVGYNNNAENSFGFMGSFAIGSIKGDTKARLEDVTITGADTVAVNVAGTKVGSLDTILDSLGSSSVNDDFDFTGAAAFDNTEIHTSDDGTGSAYSYGSEGERIIAVAGVLQAGGSNLGLSYAHADVQTEKTAIIKNANINTSSTAASSIDVSARDEALLYTVAAGLGVATGKYSGVGSVAVNSLNNNVRAELGDWDGYKNGTVYADDVSVIAQNDMDLVNVAGSVAISSGTGFAAGLAVALNLIGDSGHETLARIGNVDLEASGDVTVKAASGSDGDANLSVGNAIGIGASTGSSGLAFAGALSVTDMDQTVQAAIKNVGSNSLGSASSTGGTIRVQSADYTDSVSTAWMGAGSASGSAGGIAAAVNRVDSDVTSEILGDDSSVGSTTLNAKHVYVEALRDNWLLTIDAGVAASKQVSVAPSIGTGVVDGNVTARIAHKAKINAYGNVGVEALANTENLVGSGAVGVGLNGGAGAIAISTAAEYGKTQAYIEDANVKALGLAGTFNILDGELSGMTALPDLSATDEDSDGNSSAVGNGDVSMDDLTTAFGSQNLKEGTEAITGIGVNATSFVKQQAITVGGSGGKNVAITANVATNVFESSTDAYIKNSTINSGVSNQDGADVTVRGSSHDYGLGVSAGIAVSLGGSGVGGFSTNLMGKSASAEIDNSTISADDLTLEANSTQLAQAVSAGVAAGVGAEGGIGGTASVTINLMKGGTKAWLHDSTVTAGDVVVNAERRQDVNSAAGSAGIGTNVGVGIGLAVNILGGDSTALIGNDLDDNSDADSTLIKADNVTLDADRLESVNSYSLGAGVSTGVGVAAMINVTEVKGETRAAVHGLLHDNGTASDSTDDYFTTQIVGQDGSSDATSVTVNAQEILDVDQETLGIGVGNSVGVGAVANVVLGRSQVYSEVVGSDIDTVLLDMDATAQREAWMISIAGGASTNVGAALSIGVALFGQGDTTTEDGTNAEDEFDPSRQSANSVMAEDTAAYNPHLSAEDIAAIEEESGSIIESSSAPSTATSTESGNSLKLSGESVVAARISGGDIDADTLDVDAQTLLHTYQGLGAASLGSIAIGGAVGVTRLYDMTIATVDADLTASNVTVDAQVMDVSDEDAAGEMKSFVISGGGTGVAISYNDMRSELRTVAGVTSAAGDDTGDLSVSARDTTELRVGDLDAGKPGDPTEGSLSVSVGAAAIGVSIGFAEKNSDVDVWLGATGQSVDGYNNIDLDAYSAGLVKTSSFALAGGLLAGVQGVVTDARDESNVNATVYGTISAGSGAVNIDAQAVPEVYSRAYGVTVAVGGSMGGSFSYAIADTKAEAEAADGTYFTGEGTVTIRAETGDGSDEDYVSADANAFAASGGLLAGVAGSEALARNSSQAVATVGDGVRIPDNDFGVYARNTAVQYADADGYFVGLYAGGFNFSTAESKTSARVEYGSNPISNAVTRTGDFILDAYNYDENQSFTTAGGGGYYAGSAAVSNANSYNNSSDNKAASVEIADWASGYTSVPLMGGEVRLSAAHESQFFAGTDSTTVSVVGGSGAVANSDIDNDAAVNLGQNVSFEALQIDIEADNTAMQIQSPAESGFETSINAGAGGAANGSAAISNQDLTGIDATVSIGQNAVLAISDLAWLDSEYDHGIFIDAHSRFNVYDASVLKVGGALQGAGSESDIDASTSNTVNIGNNALIYNPVGEIGIGTYTTGSATAQAETTVWAIAGVAGGVSDVDVTVTNKVDIGQDVVINGYGDIGIYAGRGSNYLAENQLSADARTNVYNWTAVPIPAGNSANADINLTNEVILGDDIDIGSDGYVNVEANEGSLYANAEGVERNPYLELFSTETTFGSSDTSANSTLVFEGSGSVIAGQNAYQWVDIDDSGNITSQLAGYGVAEQLSDKYSSRASLQAYIDELQALVDEYENWTADTTTTTGTATDGTDDSGTGGSGSVGGTSTTGDSSENPYLDEINALKTEIANLNVILSDLSEQENNVISVTGIAASAGNVSLVADSIDLQGSFGNTPVITARGDAYIDINNRDDQHLLVGNLYIANQTGGNVYVTGGASLDSSYITEENSTTTGVSSGIHITHNPSGTNYLNSDVIVDGNITNLLSTVDITLEEGDLLQQAAVSANTINITVENGSLVVNAGSADISYGRTPSSLVNFTDKWKPSTADDFVHYWISDRYEADIDAVGINEFNNWFYACATANECHIGGTAYNDEISYFNNPSDDNADYDWIHVFFNWGFSDSQEYGGSDAVDLKFKTDSSSRGGRHWKFQPVYDKTGNLVRSASYSSVKSDLGAPGATIVGEKVVINARRVDINGTIEVGTENSWSVSVGSGFDSAIAQYIAAAGLSDGDQVSLTPGGLLRVNNPDYINSFMTPFEARYIYFDPQVSKISGAEGIMLTYDVASKQLLVDDVPVSGGGYLSINAMISSTSEDGKILVRDGLGQIDIDNYSNTDLVINSLDAGDDAVGIVRITDHNFTKNMNDGGSTRDYYSHWYVHSPGGQIQEYETTSYAASWEDGTYLGASGGAGTTSSTTYNPLAGQLHYMREDASVSRTYNDFPDGYLAKYPDTVGDWQGTGASGALEWNLGASYYTSCAANPGACTNGSATGFIQQELSATGIKKYQWGIGYSYSDYYGSNWTNTDPGTYIPYELSMSAHTFVKGDNTIGISFTGVGTGSIDIDSNAGVIINGNIYNPLGTTDINTSASLTTGTGASFDADILRLYAGQGDLGALEDPLNISTDTVSLDANGGSLYFDITGKSGPVNLERFGALYDIVGTVDKGLNGVGSGIHIQSDTLNLVSYSGSIGSVGTIGDSATYDYINVDVNEVTLEAADDIAIYQAQGNLAVNTISASEDVVIGLGNGGLLNGIGQNEKTNEELAYLQTVWDRLGIQDGSAGEVAVTGYQNQFTGNYHTYWLIKQRLDDDSDAGFAINAAFMESFKNRYGVSTDAEATAAAKAEFFGLTDWFDDQVAAPDTYADAADAIGVEQKGTLEGYNYGDLFSGSYDSSYALEIDDTSSWYANLTEGSQWSQSQLDISINAAALNADAQATLSSREANIVAPNLHIAVNGGSVGQDLADLVFSIDRSNPVITDAQKIALLEAGPGDIETTENGDLVTFSVSQVDPIKIDTTGELNVSATDEIYIESASGLTIGNITSSTSDVRLAVNGAISTASTGINIAARDLYIANTQGDIGAGSSNLKLQLSGVLRQAGAADSLYLTQTGADLVVDAVSAGNRVWMVSSNDIVGLDSESVISGSLLGLYTGNNLGSSTQALNLRMTGGGQLGFNADNAWLNIADTSEAKFSGATTGVMHVDVSGNLVLAGDVRADALDLYAAGDILASVAGLVEVNGLAKLEADNIELDTHEITIGSGDFDATAGGMTLGNVTTTGDLDLLTTGHLQFNGDVDVAYTNASIGTNARLLADAQSMAMAMGTELRSETDITLVAVDSLDLQTLIARGDINLSALNLIDGISGSISAAQLTASNVMADAQASLTLDSVNAGNIDLDGNTILVTGNLLGSAVTLDADNGLEVRGDIGSTAARTASISLNGSSGNVALGGSAYSSGAFLVSNGNLFTLADGSVVDASSINVTAAGLAADANSQLVSSNDAGFDLGASGTEFGALNITGTLQIDSAGDVVFLSDATVGSDLALYSAGDVAVSDAVLVDVAGSLRGIAGASAQANSWSMGAGSHLMVDGDVGVDTLAGQEFAALTVGGAMTLIAGDDIAFNDSANIGGFLDISGAADLAFNGNVAVGTAAANYLSIDVDGVVSQAAGQQLTSSDVVTVLAAGWNADTTSLLQSGSSAEFTLSGDSSFGLLTTAADLTLDAGADLTFQNTTTVGSAMAGADMLLEADGAVMVADDVLFDLYGALRGIAGTTATVGSFNAGSGSLVRTRGKLQMQSADTIRFAQLTASDDVTLNAGGDMAFDEAGTIAGALLISDAGDVSFVGNLTVGNATSLGGVDLAARGAVNQSAGQSLASYGDVIGSAGSWTMGADALLQSLSGSIQLATTGDMTLEKVDGVTGIALNSGGALTFNNALTTNANFSVDAASLAMDSGASLQVAGDFDATTTGDQQYALLDIAGAALLTAGGDIYFNDTADFGSALTVVDGDNLALVGEVSAASADLTLRGDVSQFASEQFSIGNALTASANSWSMGDAALLQSGGSMNITTAASMDLARLDSGTLLVLDSGAGVALRERVSAGGSIGITAVGNVDLYANQEMSTAGDFTLDAYRFVMGDSSLLSVAGVTTIRTRDSQQLFALDSAGDTEMVAGGDWQLMDTMQIGGDLSLQSGGAIGFGGDSDIAGNAQVVAADAVGLDAGLSLVVGGSLDATAASWNMGAGSLLETGAEAAIETEGAMVLAQVQVGGDAAFNSGAGIRFDERAEIVGNLQLNAAAELLQSEGQHLVVHGDFTARAASWQMLADARFQVLGEGDIVLDGDAALRQLNVGGDLSLQSGGEVALQRDIYTGGDFAINAAGNLDLAADALVRSGGAVTLETNRWTMGAESRVEALGPIVIRSDESMLLAELSSSWSGDYAFDLQSGGSISGRTDTELHLQAENGGRSYLAAATGIGDPLVMDLPWFAAVADDGDINLVLVNDAHAELLSAQTGEVRVRAFGDVEIGELLGTPHLWIDGFLLVREMTVPQGTFIAGEGLQVDQVNLTSSGPLVAQGPRIDINVDAQGNAEAFMTLTGVNGAAADWVGVNVDNTQRLTIDRLFTDYGAIATSGDLRLESAEVQSELAMESGGLSLSLSNVDLTPKDVTGQLVTPYGEFWLDTTDNLLFTNAQVTRYRSPLVLTYQGKNGGYSEGEPGFSRLSMEYQLENTVRGEKATGSDLYRHWYPRLLDYLISRGLDGILIEPLDPDEYSDLDADLGDDIYAEIQLEGDLAARN